MNEKGKCRGYGVEKNVSCEEYRISGAALNVFERGARRFEIETVDVHGQGHVLCSAKDADEEGDKDEAVVACAADQAAFVGFKAP